MRNDHNTIATLERLRATEEQVNNMAVRADAAEKRIVDYINELAKVKSHCDAQVAEMSAACVKHKEDRLTTLDFKTRERITNSPSAGSIWSVTFNSL